MLLKYYFIVPFFVKFCLNSFKRDFNLTSSFHSYFFDLIKMCLELKPCMNLFLFILIKVHKNLIIL